MTRIGASFESVNHPNLSTSVTNVSMSEGSHMPESMARTMAGPSVALEMAAKLANNRTVQKILGIIGLAGIFTGLMRTTDALAKAPDLDSHIGPQLGDLTDNNLIVLSHVSGSEHLGDRENSPNWIGDQLHIGNGPSYLVGDPAEYPAYQSMDKPDSVAQGELGSIAGRAVDFGLQDVSGLSPDLNDPNIGGVAQYIEQMTGISFDGGILQSIKIHSTGIGADRIFHDSLADSAHVYIGQINGQTFVVGQRANGLFVGAQGDFEPGRGVIIPVVPVNHVVNPSAGLESADFVATQSDGSQSVMFSQEVRNGVTTITLMNPDGSTTNCNLGTESDLIGNTIDMTPEPQLTDEPGNVNVDIASTEAAAPTMTLLNELGVTVGTDGIVELKMDGDTVVIIEKSTGEEVGRDGLLTLDFMQEVLSDADLVGGPQEKPNPNASRRNYPYQYGPIPAFSVELATRFRSEFKEVTGTDSRLTGDPKNGRKEMILIGDNHWMNAMGEEIDGTVLFNYVVFRTKTDPTKIKWFEILPSKGTDYIWNDEN